MDLKDRYSFSKYVLGKQDTFWETICNLSIYALLSLIPDEASKCAPIDIDIIIGGICDLLKKHGRK